MANSWRRAFRSSRRIVKKKYGRVRARYFGRLARRTGLARRRRY